MQNPHVPDLPLIPAGLLHPPAEEMAAARGQPGVPLPIPLPLDFPSFQPERFA